MRNPIYILFTILLLTSCSGGGSRSNEQSHNDNVASNPTYDYGIQQKESSVEQEDEDEEYELHDLPNPSYSYDDEEMSEEERYFAHFSNFEPGYNDRKGVVVYEGQGDYYIIETTGGFVIAERYSGILYEDHTIYGPLHSYGFKYFIDLNRDSEVKLYI